MHPFVVLINMNIRKDYEKLFSRLKSPEPPEEIFDKIMHRIHRQERFLALRRRIIVFSLGLVGSLAAFIPAFSLMQQSLAESGFTQFSSLIFSDFGIVLTYWQNFALTLLESLPVLSIVAFLATIFIFLESLKFLVRDTKAIFATSETINN